MCLTQRQHKLNVGVRLVPPLNEMLGRNIVFENPDPECHQTCISSQRQPILDTAPSHSNIGNSQVQVSVRTLGDRKTTS